MSYQPLKIKERSIVREGGSLMQDVVKDILAFADTGAGDEALPDVASDQRQPRAVSPSASSRSSGETEQTANTG